jgi:hypothetical protein
MDLSASFPQIYFVIGKFEVGGTQFADLLYIGAELMCASSASPLEEIKESLRPMISDINDIATVCIHEIIHYQQHYQEAKNILEGALIEGGVILLQNKLPEKLPHNPALVTAMIMKKNYGRILGKKTQVKSF